MFILISDGIKCNPRHILFYLASHFCQGFPGW